MMEDKLIELLSSLNYPVYRQGSFANGQPYPESFFTFWNTDSPDHSHYDNADYATDWAFDVNFYSTDPEIMYSTIIAARILLKQNNWIIPSKGYDVVSDEPSHVGRGFQALYLDTGQQT